MGATRPLPKRETRLRSATTAEKSRQKRRTRQNLRTRPEQAYVATLSQCGATHIYLVLSPIVENLSVCGIILLQPPTHSSAQTGPVCAGAGCLPEMQSSIYQAMDSGNQFSCTRATHCRLIGCCPTSKREGVALL